MSSEAAAAAQFTCGRYNEPFAARVGDGKHYWDPANTCSYCGSLNQDELMRRLEAGDVELGPTDKSYKVYVRNRGGAPFKQHFRDCYNADLSKKEPLCKGPDDCTHWVTRDRDDTKFYFQHLTEEQRTRFIELVNEKKVHIGYPGYFYVLPFFASRKE